MYLFTMFDQAGAFRKTVSCGDLAMVPLNTEVDEVAIEGAFSSAYFLSEGTPTLRPVMPLVFPETTTVGAALRIDGIPTGTQVTGPNFSVVVDDGFIEWAAMVAGEYRITLENFPYVEEVVNARFTNP